MSDGLETSGGGIAKLVGLLGWIAVAGGVALIAYGIYALMQSDFGLAAGGPLMAGGAVTAALGLIAILNATMARAMIDTANNTARLIAMSSAGGVAASAVASADQADDVPGLPPAKEQAAELGEELPEMDSEPGFGEPEDAADLAPPYEPAPYAPPAPTIVADTSDPRLWPLAIDEFDLDGRLAMTLEDGSIAVETPEGWRRLPNLDDARSWLSQQA